MCTTGSTVGWVVRYAQERTDIGRPTCDVHTLLKTTNTNVCTNHVNTVSSLLRPKSSPVPRDSTICGTKLVRGERRSCLQRGMSSG